MRTAYELLLEAIRRPDSLRDLEPHDWEVLLSEAASARLSGRLLDAVDHVGLPQPAPGWLSDRFASTRAQCREYERALRWEINRVQRAMHGEAFRCVLLKGAAYVAASLPPARGRLVADIDVLVPFDALGRAEQLLAEHGWEIGPFDEYDTRYYREWMHEIPPMTHRDRGSVIDVHHAILPRTSRLRPDAAVLIERAVPVGRDAALVLCPPHMVLHAAVHLFHDGEIAGAVRDLADLDGLLRHFSLTPAFWDDLSTEAQALGLERPLYYAVRYAARVFGTPVPPASARSVESWGPPSVVRQTMDALVGRVLGRGPARSAAAALALYVRSHWLRMPPGLLARHLARKALSRAGRERTPKEKGGPAGPP
jgi:hypothetical protein